MTRWMLLLAALVAMPLAAGCDTERISGGVQLPEYHSADGTWQGATGNTTLRVVLAQAGTTVTGTGSLRIGTQAPVSLTASGTNVENVVRMTLRLEGFADVAVRGDMWSETRIEAHLDGSGYDDVGITLSRQ